MFPGTMEFNINKALDDLNAADFTLEKMANLPMDKSSADNLSTDQFSAQNLMAEIITTNEDMYGMTENLSTAPDSTSEKRKREFEDSHEARDKRRKKEVTESLTSGGWQQPVSNIQALSSVLPSSSNQQLPAAHQGSVKPHAVENASFYQPSTSTALPGNSQNPLQNDTNINYYQQQLLSYYQQQVPQQQLPQQQLQQQPQQQLQQQPQEQQRPQKQKQKQRQQQQQQYQQQQQQEQQIQHMQYQQSPQQQPSVSYYNQLTQNMAASTYSANASPISPLLSTALTTPKSSGRGKKRASTLMDQPEMAQQYLQAYQMQLNQIVLQNMLLQGLQQQQFNLPSSLQITPALPSQMQTAPKQNSGLTTKNTTVTLQNPAVTMQNPALSVQNSPLSLNNPAPSRSKSRSNTSSPLPRTHSPLSLSNRYSPMPRGQSPLSLIQSPSKGTHAPLPSSTSNMPWQQHEELQQLEQHQQSQQSQQQDNSRQQSQQRRQSQQRENDHQQSQQQQNDDHQYQQQQNGHYQNQQEQNSHQRSRQDQNGYQQNQQQQNVHYQSRQEQNSHHQNQQEQNANHQNQQQQNGHHQNHQQQNGHHQNHQQQNGHHQNEQQQNGHHENQQREQQQQYQNHRQYEEHELLLDSAPQSHDSRSSSIPPYQDRSSSPDQVENVDGNNIDDDDVGQLTEPSILRVPTSIMHPLNIRRKDRRRRQRVYNNNNNNEGSISNDNAEPPLDLHRPSAQENERNIQEFLASLRVTELNNNESDAIDLEEIQCILKSGGISLENKENTMKVKVPAGRKRGRRKGKKNGKRAIKKKHSKKVIVAKKECIKLEAVDIEPKDDIRVESQTIKQKCAISESYKVECLTIISADSEQKRKRALNQDIEILECKFQPNQMVSLAANWQSLFHGDH